MKTESSIGTESAGVYDLLEERVDQSMDPSFLETPYIVPSTQTTINMWEAIHSSLEVISDT